MVNEFELTQQIYARTVQYFVCNIVDDASTMIVSIHFCAVKMVKITGNYYFHAQIWFVPFLF